MAVYLAAFASELTKLSEAKDKERKGYGHAMVAAAPFAAASAAADVPKGWVDKYVEQTIRRIPSSQRESSLRRGVARGTGRLGAGVFTSPIFLSGVKDLRSDDPERKKKGYAKIVGSGLAFSTMKGGIEAGVEHAHSSPAKVLAKMRSVASARGAIGAASAVATAAAIANATKNPNTAKGEKKKSLWGQYGMPAAVGAGTGVIEAGLEGAMESGRKLTPRAFAGKAGGRAVAGALGATVLTGLVKKLSPGDSKVKDRPGYRLVPSKKDPTKKRWQKIAEAQQPDMYQDVRQWAKTKNDVEVYGFMKQVDAEGIGERSQSRRSAYYALHDEMQSRGRDLPTPPMRRQIEQDAPSGSVRAPTLGDEASVAALATAPGLVAGALMSMEPDDKEHLLNDALDRTFIQDKLRRHVSSDYSILPDSGDIYLPQRGTELPGVVAHEIGHSSPGLLRRSTIAHPSTAIAQRAGAFASVAIPLAIIMSAGDGRYATRRELEQKAKLTSAVGTLAALAQTPGILEEVAANVQAVRVLKQVGDTDALSRVLRQAGPGFASYLAPMLVPMLAAHHLRRRARAREKK